MNFKLLELHFSQLQAEWKNAKYNNYSDLRKKEYHENLAKIIKALETEDFNLFNAEEIEVRYHVISFLFKSLEFLNNSTTSTIPFEIVFVLTEALKDWVPTEDYLIVTSLNNDINSFSFDNTLMFKYFYDIIDSLYEVKFKHKLIQINLPRSISKDYLANVVLYHELGHFIDRKYEITRVIYIELLRAIQDNTLGMQLKNEILSFFPYFTDNDIIKYFDSEFQPFNIFANHIAEYFCDLFASQYINTCSNKYLNYLTLGQTGYSDTHPTTVNRIALVNNFLNSKKSYLIELYKNAVRLITSRELEIRAIGIDSDNFESLIPVEITDRSELHSLFNYGWKLWLRDWETINQKSQIQFELSQVKVYEIINNLIEKSIGNYIVRREWESTKT